MESESKYKLKQNWQRYVKVWNQTLNISGIKCEDQTYWHNSTRPLSRLCRQNTAAVLHFVRLVNEMCVCWVKYGFKCVFCCLGVLVNSSASHPAVLLGTVWTYVPAPPGSSLHVFIIYSLSPWSSQMELLSRVLRLGEPSGETCCLFCVKAWAVRSVTSDSKVERGNNAELWVKALENH